MCISLAVLMPGGPGPRKVGILQGQGGAGQVPLRLIPAFGVALPGDPLIPQGLRAWLLSCLAPLFPHSTVTLKAKAREMRPPHRAIGRGLYLPSYLSPTDLPPEAATAPPTHTHTLLPLAFRPLRTASL